MPYFGLLTAALIRSMPSFTLITSSLNSMKYTLASFEKIHDEIKKLSNKNIVNKTKEITLRKTFNEIDINGLNFSYNKNKILSNISISIKKGEFVGIIGKTGSGKSTLANIILGLIKPDNASVYIDKNKVGSLYQNFSYGYVPQEKFLVNKTIEENIALGLDKEEINNQLMNKVIGICELDEVVKEFKDRLNTPTIGERGSMLSGGQKQRVAIARSLYREPEIIVFDESTNQIDTKTKIKIINNLKEYIGKLTILFITHDTELYKFFDKLINLDDLKKFRITLFNFLNFRKIFHKFSDLSLVLR